LGKENNMKLINFSRRVAFVFVVVVLLIIIFPGLSNAQMGMMGTDAEEVEHSESLEDVMRELGEKYNVDSARQIDCGDIKDEDLEKLGDAVMSSVHPETEVHERMDEMMGGEGSESLSRAHINMGRNYLGCPYEGGSFGMMGGGMMSGFGNGFLTGNPSVMPMYAGYNSGLFGLNQALSILVSVSLITFLIAGARWFWRKGNK
jgi:hypothetical protein